MPSHLELSYTFPPFHRPLDLKKTPFLSPTPKSVSRYIVKAEFPETPIKQKKEFTMKVKFNYGIRTYSGTLDEMTFGSYRKNSVCIARKYVQPRLTDQNTLMGATLKNLASVYADLSAGYLDELKIYAQKNEINTPKGKVPPTAFAIWVKMMFLFSELDEGHIDLKTITYTDLTTVGEDILSIATSVENGYLAKVPGADALTANM